MSAQTQVTFYEEESGTSLGLLSGILILFLFGASIGHCWWVGDYVAMVSIGAINIGCLLGYCLGLWKTIGSAAGVAVGFYMAESASTHLVPQIEKQLGRSLTVAQGQLVSGVAVGLLVSFVFAIVGFFLFRSSRFLKRCDRYSGFVFGLGNTTALVAILLWGLLASEPMIQQLQKSAGASLLVQRLDLALTATKQSYVMGALEQWNPFSSVPQFQELKKQLDELVEKRAFEESGRGTIGTGRAPADLGLQRLIDVVFGDGDIGA